MDNSAVSQPAHYGEEMKQQHVSRWLSSGQSKKVYSDSQNICYGTFKAWVKKYHEAKPAIAKQSVSNFVSLDVKSSQGMNVGYAEIHYPNGSKLVIHKPIPIEELRRLLP